MKTLLAFLALAAIPTVVVPQCIVVHDGICFESQRAYDIHMGWGPEEIQSENNANKNNGK
jgi:hypothetical protein